MSSNEIEFPEMRLEIINGVSALADNDRQHKLWLAAQPTERLEDAIHSLYDDSPGLFEHPRAQVGIYLRNEEEAKAIEALFFAIEQVFSHLGMNAPTQEYLGSSLWNEVVAKAQHARNTMLS